MLPALVFIKEQLALESSSVAAEQTEDDMKDVKTVVPDKARVEK